jgi:hypothetical protein
LGQLVDRADREHNIMYDGLSRIVIGQTSLSEKSVVLHKADHHPFLAEAELAAPWQRRVASPSYLTT